MKQLLGCACAISLLLVAGGVAEAWSLRPCRLHRTNQKLCGRILDFTSNHGRDRRIWSPALCERRDLYVYLPPGFDPNRRYPLGIFLHGATQDEQVFLKMAPHTDKAIAEGKLPPLILAAPDGSLTGRRAYLRPASFFANTRAGRYEDYLMFDVWNFLMQTFPILPDREAHALIGVSMGGSAAFAHAIKYKHCLKMAVGFAPALNLRWLDCCGNYFAPFRPDCWGWRNRPMPLQVVGKPNSLIKVRFHNLYGPIVGTGRQAIVELSQFNPIEILMRSRLQPGELDLFVAYGGQDEFNIAAQVESFLYVAGQRGINVDVAFDPQGRHDFESGKRLFPATLQWVAPRVPSAY